MKHHPIVNDRLSVSFCQTRFNPMETSRKSAPRQTRRSNNGRSNVSFVAVKSRKGDFSPSAEGPASDYGRSQHLSATPFQNSDDSLLISESLKLQLTSVSPVNSLPRLS